MIAKINEAKTLIKHILFDYKYKFDSRACSSNQWNNRIIKHVNRSVKIIISAKNIIIAILGNLFVKLVNI